jgi:hypothetical protein
MPEQKLLQVDVDQVFRKVQELNEQLFKERDARLEANKDRLQAEFKRYEKASLPIQEPDADALFYGFRNAVKDEDYATILRISSLLDKYWLFEHKEIWSYCAQAKHFTGQ